MVPVCAGQMDGLSATSFRKHYAEKIHGQGNATPSFQYVEDCVDGLRAFMESDWGGGPINIGCETETSIIDLATLVVQRVSKLAGGRISDIRHGDPLPDEPLRRKPDCALAR